MERIDEQLILLYYLKFMFIFQTLTNVFRNLATQMPHVKIFLVCIISRARRDSLVMKRRIVQVI